MDLAVAVAGGHAGRARPLAWVFGIGFAVSVALIYYYSMPGITPYDHYGRLAEAMLHGRLDIINPPPHLELTRIGDRFYVIPPPLPALLVVPIVGLVGPRLAQALLSAAAGGAAAALAVLIATRMKYGSRDRVWLGVLFAFGTIIWYLAAVGSVWYVAHVIGALALNLALLETLGKKRPHIIGAAVAAALWSHLPTVLTLPFFVIMTSEQWAPQGLRSWRTIRLGYLNALAGPIAVVLLLNFGYNWLRFGTIADISYRMRNNVPNEWWFERGLFHLSYIPRHLHEFLRAGPVFKSTFPYITYSPAGLAVWITSPALLYALLAPLRAKGTWAAWAGIIPTAIVVMSIGATGAEQFGYRLAVDFYPLLFYLAISGLRPPLRGVDKAVISLSVVINLCGIIWHRMGWRAWF